MLTRARILNFRSLVHVDVPLKPLTVLIGKNDSGKSTFLQAFVYLTHSAMFDCTDRTYYDVTREISIEVHTAGGAEAFWGIEGRLGSVPGGAAYPAADAAELYQLPVQGASMISDGYSDRSGAHPLGSKGEGVPSLLDYLLRRDRARFFELVESLKDHIPGLKDIEIATPQPAQRRLDLVLESGFRMPAEEASAGVRLIIFFIALAFHPTPPKIILLEEPETGIHPRRLEDVVRLLRQITRGEHGAEPAQVILTTHSPYLLDYVNPEEDQVLVFRRHDYGFRTAEPVDTERLKDFLSEFMLGEVWYNQGEEGLIKR